ncbi:hypothetical protein BKK79_25390 [Cupriavidus sp. USMAA2-4]|uniref:DUF1839 family protein n=1 Tax=Cupriavidus malaysiensis TaxID=367825 RepID=A0ABN4TLS2_9BURK|nr:MULTISPECIES: DUF1839 family protein [Cupriavidus]AOY95141.1 hypothetical protein BKK79_25390 [Cupriavidus sp. USMAA2-4]AOZ08302.1 hypothetical protein BKK80_20160 [Cupriavidus malaysiensis]
MERNAVIEQGGGAGCLEPARAESPQDAQATGSLHGADAVWQETNCYMDLWIELLQGWRLEPRAALPFTVTQDFEGDHFTFFKYPPMDLERLYGTVVQEMAVYDTLEAHVAAQVGRGHVVLVEFDSFYLPDTRATSYRSAHVKTTAAVDAIDTGAQWLDYYHSLGHYRAEGDDYQGLLRLTPALSGNGDVLFPYAECVKRVRPALRGQALADGALDLLRLHLARRPADNPLSRWRQVFDGQVASVLERGDAYFHHYGFNLPRQLGANFEMLHHFLAWLAAQGHAVPAPVAEAARTIAEECKVLQFRLARAVARRRHDGCHECLDALEGAYAQVMDGLVRHFGTPAPD